MAVTTWGVNDASAVKLWSKVLDAEVLKETYYERFAGTSAMSLINIKTELNRSDGDEVKFSLRYLLSGRGVGEGQPLVNNEEALSIYQDSLKLGYLRHGVRFKSEVTIDAQRIPFNIRSEARDAMKDWWPDRLDTIVMNHLCGYTPANVEGTTTGLVYTGGNIVLAPSANRIIRAKSLATDQAVAADSTAVLTLQLIDQAVYRARTSSPTIRPIRQGGKEYYVLFISEEQALSLRADTATAGSWFDLQKARLQGGEADQNGIFTGAFGMYNNTVIHVSNRVTRGVNSVDGSPVNNTRRAVFCGAQALAAGFGQKNGLTKFSWAEEEFDYGEEIGIKAGLVFGFKKTRYKGEDYGTIVMTTYTAQA